MNPPTPRLHSTKNKMLNQTTTTTTTTRAAKCPPPLEYRAVRIVA